MTDVTTFELGRALNGRVMIVNAPVEDVDSNLWRATPGRPDDLAIQLISAIEADREERQLDSAASVTAEQLTKAVEGMEIVVDLANPRVPGEWVVARLRYPGSFASAVFARIARPADDEQERCPECSAPMWMHHDPGCSQSCGRCAARKTAQPDDPELDAISAILTALADLADIDAVERVITYVAHRLNVTV